MKIINNVKKLKSKLVGKNKTKDSPDSVQEGAKSKFYIQETSLVELNETEEHLKDFESLFDVLKKNLKKMSDTHQSLLKHKERIAKTFNCMQKDELSRDDLLINSLRIQNLNKDSQLCIETLIQQERICEDFVFNSFKLYDMLNKYEKKLRLDSEQVIKNKKRQSFALQRPISRDLDEYFDTVSQFSDKRNRLYSTMYRQSSTLERLSEESISRNSESDLESIVVYRPQSKPRPPRRTEIPIKPSNSNVKMLISLCKNLIGKDITKIPLPASFFCEPISFLQRNVECLEYSILLDKAAECTDSLEQMGYVAAFCVSEYSTYYDRLAKPFNPLLHETFEFDREDDKGWKCVSEQVSHHPPHFAVYAESIKDWKLEFDTTVTTKFKGPSLDAQPSGTVYLTFKKSGNYYSWNKIKTVVNGIIYGKLWISNHGDMQIVNHKNNEKCFIKYHEPSFFSKETTNKITGIINDNNNMAQYILEGNCTELIERFRVLSPTTDLDLTKDLKKLNLGPSEILWKRITPDPKYKLMYNFTQFTIEMNEMEANVAPTDSRLRPDQRLLEDGNSNEADVKKIYLEENQRKKLKQYETEPEPIWFKKINDPITMQERYVFTNEYWECKKNQDWSRSPQLF